MHPEDPVATEKRDVVLIVEDDATFRRLLARSLEMQGFDTREAENGLIAKTIFDLNSEVVKLVISDIRLPSLDGLGLLAHVRSKSTTPVILMTGFSEILETQDAFELGATDFIAKPFSTRAMIETIRRCLNSPGTESSKAENSEPAAKQPGQTYCAVHIDEFISTSKLRSDIYVRLSDEKYVKVAHANQVISVERLRTYKERRVEHLYVTIDDFQNYVDFSLQLVNAANKMSGVSKDKKIRLLKHTTEVIVEKCFLSEIDSDIVAPAKRLVENTLAMVASDPDTLSVFSNLKTYSDRIYAHSVAVSVYSCMVAQQHGWTSANTQFRLAISGLLHDIGKKELPKKMLAKARFERSAEEIELFESHPIRGRDIVLQLRALPEDIAIIVAHHHESPSGVGGYPNRLSSEVMHPLAKLVGTVDRFAELVLPLLDNAEPLSPHQALDKLTKFNMDLLDVTFLRRLMAIFKYTEKSDAPRAT